MTIPNLRFNVRSIPKIIAWVMLTFIFFSMLFNIMSPSEEQTVEIPKHYTDRVMHVGVTFVKEWLTINSEEKEEDYKRRISPFLKSDLVPRNAGFKYPKKEYNLQQKVELAWVEFVRQLDSTHYIANIGVLLDTNGTKRKMVVNVPIARNSSDQFIVYENPSFSPIASLSDVSDMDFGEAQSVRDMKQLNTTLTNFFAKYIESNDQAELINFLIDDAKGYVHPKGGVVKFKSVDNIVTYPRGITEDGSYNVYMGKVRITTTDVVSGIDFSSDYIVAIYEQGSKYLIGNIAP